MTDIKLFVTIVVGWYYTLVWMCSECITELRRAPNDKLQTIRLENRVSKLESHQKMCDCHE